MGIKTSNVITYAIILVSLLMFISGCTPNNNNVAPTNNNGPANIANSTMQDSGAKTGGNLQADAKPAKQNSTTPSLPNEGTGIVFATGLKYVKSANMYEGNINFALEGGQKYTLNNVCVAANNFAIGQCYRINIANVDKVRAQEDTSAMLNGCYIPDFSNNTLQKVSCPKSLS